MLLQICSPAKRHGGKKPQTICLFFSAHLNPFYSEISNYFLINFLPRTNPLMRLREKFSCNLYLGKSSGQPLFISFRAILPNRLQRICAKCHFSIGINLNQRHLWAYLKSVRQKNQLRCRTCWHLSGLHARKSI